MNNHHPAAMNTSSAFLASRSALCGALVLALATLGACGNKAAEKKPGQALASVNGEEVTVLQLNEEMQRAGVAPAQQDAASKQLLQVLIDRQLLQEAAARESLDRDPKVMQAIDRARADHRPGLPAEAHRQRGASDAGRGRGILQQASGIVCQPQAVQHE
ncbi:SurA N-terminal domain-containing protein [Massilia forsythiae]|uniref:SurA N-terminal domain-containing protein n=1 Tax=Massilia forsythiae TaxID=2728020 RepID=UPI001E3A54AB|nr:SurA N-terminal domain-containing protein [Massilia forsythiae]